MVGVRDRAIRLHAAVPLVQLVVVRGFTYRAFSVLDGLEVLTLADLGYLALVAIVLVLGSLGSLLRCDPTLCVKQVRVYP